MKEIFVTNTNKEILALLFVSLGYAASGGCSLGPLKKITSDKAEIVSESNCH
jgi:hypothetical protein